MANKLIQTWDKIPSAGKIIIIAGGTFGVYKGIKTYKANKERKAVKKLIEDKKSENTIKVITTAGGGVGVTKNIDLGQAVINLHDALNYGAFGWFEDEEIIMRELMNIPKPYMVQVETIFSKVYPKEPTLETQIRKALSGSDWNRVEFLFQ